jgi:hypothetical protein
VDDVIVRKLACRFGAPIGKMVDVMKNDIAAFAKELDPLIQ